MVEQVNPLHPYAVKVFGNEAYSPEAAVAFMPPPPTPLIPRSDKTTCPNVARLLDDIAANKFQPPLTDAEQHRFLDVRELEARLRQMNNDHPTALASLIRTIHWYRHEGIAGLRATMFSETFRTAGIYRRGFDLDGRPIIWIKPGQLLWESANALMTKLVIYHVERAIRSVPKNETDGRFVVIIDVSGVNWLAVNYTWIKEMAELCLQHYPERVARIHVFNGGVLMSTAWSLIRPILPQATVQKVNFPNDKTIDISPAVREDWLEGGTCPKPYFDPDIYWKAEALYDLECCS